MEKTVLDLETAIKLHRELWMVIAEEYKRMKGCVCWELKGEEYSLVPFYVGRVKAEKVKLINEKYGISRPIINNCYLCDYVRSNKCSICPLAKNPCLEIDLDFGGACLDGIYTSIGGKTDMTMHKWNELEQQERYKILDDAEFIARQIANLPINSEFASKSAVIIGTDNTNKKEEIT